MAKKKKEVINLLPQEEFAASTVGRILTWLLSTFRMIVIATEMVVMAAFLSRFWLDARNTDLNDLIKQKQAVILSYKDIENNFRATQSRLSILGALTSTTTDNSLFNLMAQSTPVDVILTSSSINGSDVKISGLGASEQSISQFIVNLAAQKALSKVTLSQLSSDKTGNGLIFTVVATLGGQNSGK